MYLIPSGVESYLARGIKFSMLIHAHPYEWNSKTKTLNVTKVNWKRYMWYWNVVMNFSNWVFVVSRCIQINTSDEYTTGRKIYMRSTVLYYTMPALFQIVFLWKTEELADFYYKYVTSMKKIDGIVHSLHILYIF